ncbi:sugar transferase [Dictyoglomus thermophilum]|uniref:Glycosyltransferase n=2 Tax=Dictyoglomus thermophilum TaxID=14 RepID=B5YCR5_DICT6|nr:sugar transferase [Dictyoglomus thermophilum]ACI19634.1 glycosyltransferase [Dictyoglomus thermophilum H-6-12]MCX7720183.1 sugar transferase [Dictyoglomus thermophilum]TYT23351.1 sugar transferase [Dictyoglomus thermophilum]
MKKSKRLFDFMLSLLGLFITIPIFLVVSLLIKLEDNGPIFYKQKRVGYKGKEFHIWKFRTMVVNADSLGRLITVGKDPRITKVGFWLRKFRIDEIPQLINVLKGEMSLVGPRPEVPKYLKFYDEEMRRILEYVPGMTDPTSLNFLDESEVLAKAEDPEEKYIKEILPLKVKQSLKYLERSNLWTDFLVILKTIFNLIKI